MDLTKSVELLSSELPIDFEHSDRLDTLSPAEFIQICTDLFNPEWAAQIVPSFHQGLAALELPFAAECPVTVYSPGCHWEGSERVEHLVCRAVLPKQLSLPIGQVNTRNAQARGAVYVLENDRVVVQCPLYLYGGITAGSLVALMEMYFETLHRELVRETEPT